MNKLLVPALGFAVVIGLAGLLIGAVVLRSPDTHSNLWETAHESYGRTPSSVVGEETGDVELLLDESSLPPGKPLPLARGRFVYLSRGCATCHGLDASGGPVGPSLAGIAPEVVERMVREGRGGMPLYSENHLQPGDLAHLASYLQGLPVARPAPEEIAALQRISYDQSVPVDVLLKGKSAIRRSCGACHAQPDPEDIRRAFHNDAEAASLVAEMLQETNLSVEDARAITNYMLAIRNGNDPIAAP